MSNYKKNIIKNEDNKLWKNITKKDKKYPKSNRVVFNKKLTIENNAKAEKAKEDVLIEEKNIKKIEKKIILEKNNYNYIENLDPLKIPSGISSNQAHNLQKGRIRPEIKIDLHGFTQDKANIFLKDKLTELYKKNIRCVLIITGKKTGKYGSEGVLKKEVPRWLNVSPLRQLVLMTSWAQPKDGGDGALYVLLKKKR